MTADILRDKFFNFFASKSHKIVSSDSLVPQDDPTVLFTSAGMNQFKKQFLGQVTDFRRAATCQKCLRTDDLDKVGKTSGHHTFFEMLGNFSFGDYFKQEAIGWAWEFMTEVLKVSPGKLWVSVYREDSESYKIWEDRINLPKQRIVKLGDKENFWPSDARKKGPNGPCGPCSEIFYDYGKLAGCKKSNCSPACDCGRFVEVWNLVFTQFQRQDKGVIVALPSKNIDTGMGLERLAAVMQGVKSNFDTELFLPLINSLKSMLKDEVSTRSAFYLKAISDHTRAITFAICDGVVPSNEERGYVVRKLIRLCLGYGRNLGLDKPYLYKLVPVVAEIMQKPYPEINERRENISQLILAEEEKFIDVFKRGPALVQEKFSKSKVARSGEIAFELYDTYGIPFEEIERLVKEKYGFKINKDEFQKHILKQKDRSREKSKISGDIFVKAYDTKQISTEFIYGQSEAQAKVLGIFVNQKQKSQAQEGQNIEIALDKTVFYAESGGQIGDSGVFQSDSVSVLINDTAKNGSLILHSGKVLKGTLKVGDLVLAKIDYQRRLDIARNHTATHLLQAALCHILGPHVRQQGSLVAQDKLRFDFTHFRDISNDELSRVEDTVNGFIKRGDHLVVTSMGLQQAKKLGALALFSQKYEDTVRVVYIGDYSKELCGGTHLENTKEIGLFKIVSESSIASGTRRIEAVTGEFAKNKIQKEDACVREIAQDLEIGPQNIQENVAKVVSRLRYLEARLKNFRLNLFTQDIDNLVNSASLLRGVKVIIKQIDNADLGLLRQMADLLKKRMDSFIIVLASIYENKAYFVMAVSSGLIKNNGLDASVLICDIAKFADGSGGGRKDFAQAGGKDISGLSLALAKTRDILQDRLK